MKKYVETLYPYACGKLLEVQSDLSDCIEMASSEAFDIDSLSFALKGQVKHGAIGEALPWLFLEEKEDGTLLLMMKDGGRHDAWVKPYGAVYWFICGWSDCDFTRNQQAQSKTLP